MGAVDMSALDNPVWSSISGAHAELAEVASIDGGSAGCYQHDVAPFAAVEDPRNPACWTALASILDSHATCVLVDPAAVPEGWEIVRVIPGVQMDGTALEPAEDPAAVPLTDADVPEMLALVERT